MRRNKDGEAFAWGESLNVNLSVSGRDVVCNNAITDLRESVRCDLDEQMSDNELSPEQIVCLENLESDYGRGIVVIDDEAGSEVYKAEFEKDKTAGTYWETIEARLLKNGGELLQRATSMPGGAELIGVYPNGELCMISRNINEEGNREPVIIAFDSEDNRLLITTDTPDREVLMNDLPKSGGRFGDYEEIREAVRDAGYVLPPDSSDYKKKGLVVATEVVTGKPFIKSENGEEYIDTVLECGELSEDNDCVRIVCFSPLSCDTYNYVVSPFDRRYYRGAVYVLRG